MRQPPPRQRTRPPTPGAPRLIRFNKPYGVLSQFTPEGRWQGLKAFIDVPGVHAAGACHVLTYQGAVAAVFTLSRTPEPAYDALTDGRWRSDRDHAAVLHRNAVAADWRGTGMADHLMQAAEQLARESGAHAIRVDTHRHNGAQKKLLERHGYRFCGNILCDEPGHDPRRQAFEKLLK